MLLMTHHTIKNNVAANDISVELELGIEPLSIIFINISRHSEQSC